MPQILYAIIVVLNYKRTVEGLISFVQLVIQKMTNNPNFPSAAPLLTSTTTALTAYQSAMSSTKTTKALAGQRASTKLALMGFLKQLRDLVRTAAEANPDNALAIVEGAGMALMKRAIQAKPLINVLQASVTGSVVCRAKAPGIPASYFWSYSLDQKSWVSVPQAMRAMVSVAGLTAGQTYYFRYYTITRKGTSDLSQIFSLLVK
jgi:hypothetical protein